VGNPPSHLLTYPLIPLPFALGFFYHIKLPDAIIAATAMQYRANLIIADKQLQNIQESEAVDIPKA
jgi:predicted nucleic acid-binding protein